MALENENKWKHVFWDVFLADDFALSPADFGFARHLQCNTMAATLCGSPMYMVRNSYCPYTYTS